MISGVWLPIVTPFVDGAVDFAGYERLLEHYLGKGVSGVFQILSKGTRRAEFAFNGWRSDQRRWREVGKPGATPQVICTETS